LEKIARENQNVHLQVCYSRPEAEDVAGRDYQHAGRLSIALLKELLPSAFLCPHLRGNNGRGLRPT
jgi:hypothetical protein